MFNLLHDPWIKTSQGELSLLDTIKNAHKLQLTNDFATQDLAIMRFMLAIIQRVYFNGTDNTKCLLTQGHFDDQFITYLNSYQDFFDLDHFYATDMNTFNQFVPDKKRLTPGCTTSQISLSLLNRAINQSANGLSISMPVNRLNANNVTKSTLARNLLFYQQVAGSSDKTKLVTPEKTSIDPGWLYQLDSFYFKGKSLFETLIFNADARPNQKPVFEDPNWIKTRLYNELPDNTATLYTLPSRLYCLEDAHVYTAGFPALSPINAQDLEPMTSWKEGKQGITPSYKRPGSFNPESFFTSVFSSYRPLLIKRLRTLIRQGLITKSALVNIVFTSFTYNDVASKLPYCETCADLSVISDLLVDETGFWTKRLLDELDFVNVLRKNVYGVSKSLADFSGLPASIPESTSSKFEQRAKAEFLTWVSDLSLDVDRNAICREFEDSISALAIKAITDLIKNLPVSNLFQGTESAYKFERIMRAKVTAITHD